MLPEFSFLTAHRSAIARYLTTIKINLDIQDGDRARARQAVYNENSFFLNRKNNVKEPNSVPFLLQTIGEVTARLANRLGDILKSCK